MPAETALTLILLALACTPIALLIRRAGELVVFDVRDGAVTVRRGRPPGRLLSDVRDVVRRAAVKRARLRVLADGDRPRVEISGDVDDGTAQQLRNVVGTFRTAELRRG